MVRIYARDFVPGPILDGDGQVWRSELLAKLRREGIEFRGVVVRNAASELRGNMSRGVNVELRDRAHLVGERNFLAVAQVAGRSGERRNLVGLRVQAYVVGHDTRLAYARPGWLRDEPGNDIVARRGPQTLRGILGVVSVVTGASREGAGNRSLVRNDENVAQAAEFLGHRRYEVVADQNVLVFFLHQLIALWKDDFHDVLAGGQHGDACVQIWRRNRVRRTNRAVGRGRLSVCIPGSHAGEPVHAVVGRRLELVPVVHAVIALELGIVGQRGQCGPAVLGVVEVEVVGLIIQREIEEVWNRARAGSLARAVHVGRDAVGPEALGIIVPTAGLGGVDQLQGWGYAVGGKALLVKVDGDVRNQRFPLRLNEHLRIVKRTGRRINDMALDAAVFAGDVRLLAEFEEIILAREALPALNPTSPRRIDAARGKLGRTGR